MQKQIFCGIPFQKLTGWPIGAPAVMRLACIYALLDLSNEVRPEHLRAALAFFHYAEACTEKIFGNLTGNIISDRILSALENTENFSMSSSEYICCIQRSCFE